MRINTRLDENHKRKLEYLMQVTGLRVSDIVKQVIDALDERTERTRTKPEQRLTRAGFMSCGEGPEDLLMTHKDALHVSIRTRHGHR